jgi:GT2 family glycosyltransferase
MSVTVILNGYKRGNQLNEQLEALHNQTIQPNEISITTRTIIIL